MKRYYASRRLMDQFDYETIARFLNDNNDDICEIGNHTVALLSTTEEDDEMPQIKIILHTTTVSILNPTGDSVQLFANKWHTRTTKDRLDRALIPLGYRLGTINKRFKVYSIKTGSYRDFFDGMHVTRGEF